MYRRVLSFIAVIGVALLWACDNGSDGTPSNTLEGTWNLETMTATITAEATVSTFTVTTENNIEIVDPNYQMTLEGGNLTASGSYTVTNQVFINEAEFANLENEITNAQGSGTYTNTDTEITFTGGFIDFNFDGTDLSATGEPAVSNYTISGNVLTTSQDQTIVESEQGATVVTRFVTTATWRRQ